ncbi:MAG TPA: FAD-dependent monooxygenase, partial [Acetobacteraceae bacterium]|nr:FAD-dependent monooxygenase [Acetobacteraceae bacterium]
MADSGIAAPQILIVGAGPTGLSLAITCHRFGVPVRLIDRAPQASEVSKALAVWSGSMEALAAMRVMPGFLAEGVRLRAVSAGPRGRARVSIPIGAGIDSPYPIPLLLPQSRTERLLGTRLAELGGTIERGVALAGLHQNENGITASLRHANGQEETVRPRFLVGCDGARSTVRQALGLSFEGYAEPGTFLLADARIEGRPLDPASIYIWWGSEGTVALFPVEDGVWRIIAARRGNVSGDDGAPASLPEIQAALDRNGPGGLSLHDPGWLSTFRINERQASAYRIGRCFLAGDAAHIHSPAGGQGMNTGIQDAVNLGWKLAYALHGIGNGDLL